MKPTPALRAICACLLAAVSLSACQTQLNNLVPPGGSLNTGPSTGGGVAPGGTQSVPSGDSTVLEQLQLERINRARLRPAAEAARFGIDLNEGVSTPISAASKQPLAMNATLTGVARRHSRDMLERDYFAHNTPEGLTPFNRMEAAGYVYQAAGENLAWRGTTGRLDNEAATCDLQHQDLFVDRDYPGRGHRVVMLRSDFREVGIGVVRGFFTNEGRTYDSLMLSQEFGTRFRSPMFVLGVVFDDINRNGEYDAGEGVANATVFLDTTATQTNAGGGYVFPVSQPGAYSVRFAGGAQTNVTLGNSNIKVDLVDGTRIVINLGLGPLP